MYHVNCLIAQLIFCHVIRVNGKLKQLVSTKCLRDTQPKRRTPVTSVYKYTRFRTHACINFFNQYPSGQT